MSSGDPVHARAKRNRKVGVVSAIPSARLMALTLSVVLVLTCFIMVSARLLSNCTDHTRQCHPFKCARRSSRMVETCWRTFMASCGVIAPLVISSSSESVSAMPILERWTGERMGL